MADQSDVEMALVALASATLYPDGTANASVTGGVFRVYRGWPTNEALEADLAISVSHISINCINGAQQLMPPFPQIWEIPAFITPTLTVTTADGTATFDGLAAPGQLAGLLVDNDAFAYRTLHGDTPELVATNLAALVNQVRIATVTGGAISVIGTTRLVGRVVADQAALMQTRRQRGEFKVTCWCADPISRDAAAAALDVILAQTPFVSLPDSSCGRLLFVSSDVTDDLATMPLYRRDLTYSVEYPTTITQTQPSMLFGLSGVGGPTGIGDLHIS